MAPQASSRMLKKAAQQGRNKRRGDAYSVRYGEPLSEARTPLADFFSILLRSAVFYLPITNVSVAARATASILNRFLAPFSAPFSCHEINVRS